MKFYSTLYYSSKNVVSNLRRCQENDCRSNFGLNIRNICLHNHTLDIFKCNKNSVKYFPINDSDLWRVQILKELIEGKNSHNINGFSTDELMFVANDIACN